MKKTLKSCVIVSLCMIAAGFVLLGIGLLNGGSISYVVDVRNFKVRTQSSAEDYVEKTLDMDAFSKLQLNVSVTNVEIRKGEDYQISYNLPKDEIPTIEVKGQEVIVTGKDLNSQHFTIGVFQWDWEEDSSKKDCIVITVPENAEPLEATLNVESGDVRLQDMVFETVDICADYGDIDVSGVTSDCAEISAESGDITLKNIKFKDGNIRNEYGDLVVENASVEKAVLGWESGDCKLKNLESNELQVTNEYGDVVIGQSTVNSCKIANESGEIKIEDCKGETLELNASYGDIKIDTSIWNHVQATCESGEVEIDLIGELSEYDLDLTTESGEININGEENGEKHKDIASREKSISVESEYGDVDIFVKNK